MVCAPWLTFTWTGCRAWPTSRFWATACETAFWPAGTFARAYAANRRAAIECIIEADPLAACVRTIMGERTMWSGSASDLLRLCAESAREDAAMSPPWARDPRALAGRLRRAQTFLRMLDIEISFGREGRSGARMIRDEHLTTHPSQRRSEWQGREHHWDRVMWNGLTVSIITVVRPMCPEAAILRRAKEPRRCPDDGDSADAQPPPFPVVAALMTAVVLIALRF